eukprot:5834839-Amphidinium_carterae.1
MNTLSKLEQISYERFAETARRGYNIVTNHEFGTGCAWPVHARGCDLGAADDGAEQIQGVSWESVALLGSPS